MLPDSPPDMPPDVDREAVQKLHQLLVQATKDDVNTIHQGLAMYETALASAHEANATNAYKRLSRSYREPLIELLDRATQAEGWSFLEGAIDAYHPSTSEEFPHVTTSIQNVASRHLIRTRLTDSVDAVPVTLLNYFETIVAEVGNLPEFIREGVHPYGWGIGHPNHSVANQLHTLAKEDIILTDAILEHTFYADQHRAIEVLERIVNDNSIQETLSYPTGEISEARALLDAPAGAASEFSPTIPRYWDWQAELGYVFELDEEVEQRIRNLVVEQGIDDDLSNNWGVSDLIL